MYRVRVIAAVPLIISSSHLASCGSFHPKPHTCETSDECTVIQTTFESQCALPSDPQSTRGFKLTNNSPTRKVYASYSQRGVTVNSSSPDQNRAYVRGIGARASIFMGCERTVPRDGEGITYWSYNKDATCFDDECPAPDKKPIQPRESEKTCEQLCDSGDKSCIKVHLNDGSPIGKSVTREIDKFNHDMLNATPPTSIDTSALVGLSNLYTGTAMCARGPMLINGPSPNGKGFDLRNSGASCPIGFALNGTDISELGIEWPGSLVGIYANPPGPPGYRITTASVENSPTLRLLERATSNRVEEPVVMVSAGNQVMTFTGEKYYCAQIDWEGYGTSVRKSRNN